MNEEDLHWAYRQPLTPFERSAYRIMIELLILFWLSVIAVARCAYG